MFNEQIYKKIKDCMKHEGHWWLINQSRIIKEWARGVMANYRCHLCKVRSR